MAALTVGFVNLSVFTACPTSGNTISPVDHRSEFWTVRAGCDPGLDQGSEVGLSAGSRRASLTGMPRPADKRICSHVLVDIPETSSTVSRFVLNLQTNFAQRLALPGHGGWSEAPTRVTGNTGNPGTGDHDILIPVT